jgi:NADP-reducing hydrogenase subunit HndA
MSENKCQCGNGGKDPYMEELLKQYKPEKDNLIQILNSVQEHYGYIPKHAQEEISEYLNMPMAEIFGVITFYSRFTLEPKGKYNIAVCLGTACFVKGSEKVLDKVKEVLKIDVGQTTEDGLFSIEATRCVGACGLAPVFTVNDEVYGKATPDMVESVIKRIRDEENV